MDTIDLYIPAHVHWCMLEDGIVLLDLRRGKYFALAHSQVSSLQGRVKEWSYTAPHSDSSSRPEAEPFINELILCGLLSRDTNNGETREPMLVKSATAAVEHAEILESASRVGIGHIVNLCFAWTSAKLKMRVYSFHKIVRCVAERKKRHGAPRIDDDTEIRRLAAIYCRLRPIFFNTDQECLLDSLVLIEFLARYQLFPDWIIAVMMKPFGAHSFVQDRDTILNDSLERTQLFVPLLCV